MILLVALVSVPLWRAVTLLAIVPVVRRWWISDGRQGGPMVLVWLSRLGAGCCLVFVASWAGTGLLSQVWRGGTLWVALIGGGWFFAWLIAIISAATVGALARRMDRTEREVRAPAGGTTLA